MLGPELVAKLLAGGPALGLGAWALIVIVNDAFRLKSQGQPPHYSVISMFTHIVFCLVVALRCVAFPRPF